MSQQFCVTWLISPRCDHANRDMYSIHACKYLSGTKLCGPSNWSDYDNRVIAGADKLLSFTDLKKKVHHIFLKSNIIAWAGIFWSTHNATKYYNLIHIHWKVIDIQLILNNYFNFHNHGWFLKKFLGETDVENLIYLQISNSTNRYH